MALYHTHRPQDYAELVGQEIIVTTLTNQVANGKVAHAYLFSGPRGVGKTTSARILAKAVNCINRKEGVSEPCNTCGSCKEITEGNAIDVLEIDAASNTGVDNVRTNIIENAQFRPTKSTYKIFIIDEVHMLSTSAFNALLKIMEEPPAHVLFILATTELHKIPDTIISRCQRFEFKRVPFELMKQHLARIAAVENVTVDDDVLDRLVAKSDGCVRDGMSLLDQLMALGSSHISIDTASLVLPTANREQTHALLSSLLYKSAAASLDALTTMTQEQSDMIAVADDIIDMLRAIMILKAHPSSRLLAVDMSQDTKTALTTLGNEHTARELLALTDILLRRRQEIKSAPIPQLPLEMVIVEWCSPDVSAVTTKTIPEAPKQKTPIPAVEKKESKASTIPEPTAVQTPNAPEPAAISDAIITGKMVEQAWPTFLSAVEKNSPSLIFVLKMATLESVENNTINLTVAYSFHKDKLMDQKCRDSIQKIFFDLLHAKVNINVLVRQGEKTVSSDISDLASLVGGEVVG